MTPTIRAALDVAEQHATAKVWADHPLAIILEALIKQTRDALAAEPVGEVEPSKEELYDLADEFNGDPVPAMQAALARWGRPAAPPAPAAQPTTTLALPPRVGLGAFHGHVLRLAEIIREVGDITSHGAAELAEEILAHPSFSGCHDAPAALPAQEPGEVMGPTMAEEALVALERIQHGDTSHGSDDFDYVANALGQFRLLQQQAPPAPPNRLLTTNHPRKANHV